MSDASKWLHELSEPWPKGDRVKSAIDRVARLVGLSYWRCFDIWYGKARRIEPAEIEMIADAIQKKNERDARNELHALKTRLAILEARLATGDAEFHRPNIDALRAQNYGISGVGRSVVGRRGCVAS